jgi:hypothetical protein
MLHLVVLQMEDDWILDADQNDVRPTEGEKMQNLEFAVPALQAVVIAVLIGRKIRHGTSNDIDRWHGARARCLATSRQFKSRNRFDWEGIEGGGGTRLCFEQVVFRNC